MCSIENFYWLLYENLLKPLGLDCWYYYPFGTQNNLSYLVEFQPWHPKSEHHVLFHYDQEPIWNDNFGAHYDILTSVWSANLARILANSEHSQIKKDICKERGMLDWHFFFHGFAALDWYRDSQFIEMDFVPNKIFSSLNRQVRHHRSYRMATVARLLDVDLAKFGDISFHAGYQDIEDEIHDPSSLLSEHDKRLIERTLLSWQDCPLTLDQKQIDGTASAHFGHQEYKLLQNSLVHLVNETVYYEHKLHLTEKIFKPIVTLRPFVLAAAPGNLAYLKSYGFQTFDRWWNESYDDIKDPTARSAMIVSIVENLCTMSKKDLAQMHEEMKPILHFNKKHFFGRFREIIVHELVENFDNCVKVWNNGRVDGRVLPRHPDLESVKHLLLR